MPGWIIQGVRGEGKSLCSVGKIKDYLSRGRPVATNLDLYLENLVDEQNSTLVYRLPDHPRSEDLNALPPAYDRRYKDEDRNGLLVLDESIIWLNGRSFKDKDRAKILEWLILSRKDHWDLILLCQDHEAIDKTARNALCDYLVQASRSDRMKDSVFATVRNLFMYQSYKPKVHSYEVFYGFSFTNPPVDTWEFTGTDLYDAYDTNQKFKNGQEIMGSKLVDMRAVFTYLPASYLSKHFYKKDLVAQIDHIDSIEFIEPPEPNFDEIEGKIMAAKSSGNKNELSKVKLILLVVVGVGFLVYRFATGVEMPGAVASESPVVQNAVSNGLVDESLAVNNSGMVREDTHRVTFVDKLLLSYRPRLASYVSSRDRQFGTIQFYEGTVVVESLRIAELHSLGVSVVSKPYGVDLVTATNSYVVTSWPIVSYKRVLKDNKLSSPKVVF